ncbi:MAG: hypothetical protein WB507_08070, partial [Solirubrobacterales bacterium]
MEPPRRRSWEWLGRLVGYYLLALIAHGVLDPGGGSAITWSFGALLLSWFALKLLGAIAAGRIPMGWLASLLLEREAGEETIEPVAKTPGEIARAKVARLGGGAYLGTGRGGGWVTADPESAVMVLGPPRSGKTSAVMIPAVMA